MAEETHWVENFVRTALAHDVPKDAKMQFDGKARVRMEWPIITSDGKRRRSKPIVLIFEPDVLMELESRIGSRFAQAKSNLLHTYRAVIGRYHETGSTDEAFVISLDSHTLDEN